MLRLLLLIFFISPIFHYCDGNTIIAQNDYCATNGVGCSNLARDVKNKTSYVIGEYMAIYVASFPTSGADVSHLAQFLIPLDKYSTMNVTGCILFLLWLGGAIKISALINIMNSLLHDQE